MDLATAGAPQATGLEALASGSILSPFTRMHRLLDGVPSGHARPIELTAGDPTEPMPGFVVEKLAEDQANFGTYPKIRGSLALRQSIATWIARRYGLAGPIDAEREVIAINGSREGLFFALLPAAGRKRVAGRPAVLIPNPFYQPYLGAALTVMAEPVYLDATAETGHLPNLDALEANTGLLERTIAFYLTSPANPQGAVTSPAYIDRALRLARRYNFMLFFDECYSEIYTGDPPTGGLEVAARTPERFRNIVVFNSLSKRSNLPGLRSGFSAGDPDFLETLAEVRNLTAPQMPGPIQHASAAVWAEEQHVAVIRQGYRRKFEIADQVLKGRLGYTRPAGGFFLWLDMSSIGGGMEATLTLWKRCGVKVVPGAFLAQPDLSGRNPGDPFVRVALVKDAATIREALERIVSVTA